MILSIVTTTEVSTAVSSCVLFVDMALFDEVFVITLFITVR
jgi:hypothetical protein